MLSIKAQNVLFISVAYAGAFSCFYSPLENGCMLPMFNEPTDLACSVTIHENLGFFYFAKCLKCVLWSMIIMKLMQL